MKKISFMALIATIFLCSCSKQEQEIPQQRENAPKSLEFSLGINSPKTRMSDGTVDKAENQQVAAEVRANIESVTIEYFSNANVSLGTYPLSADQISTVKSDDQAGKRVPVRIESIPVATAKVNVYVNAKSFDDINQLQTTYKTMEYRGADAVNITIKSIGGGAEGHDLYGVEVPVLPVLSRFEFVGGVDKITMNTSGNLPKNGFTGGTRADALNHVSNSTIETAESAARQAWIDAHTEINPPDDADWTYTYSVSYEYNTNPYTIKSIDEYYMNNIPSTKDDAKNGKLILNANDLNGDWSIESKKTYTEATGSMKKMFDTTVETDKRIVYNLFPQTFIPAKADAPTVNEVKKNMPHFILKLKTSAGNRWVTVRAFKSTATDTPLIDKFEAGKAYILKAEEIIINQYSAKLAVTATNNNNTTPGGEIPEDKDPTDPNPEPNNKGLEVLVNILDWETVYVKPEW